MPRLKHNEVGAARSAPLIKLPQNLSPVGTIPITICIPDDKDYKAIFYGAIARLGVWAVYERDASKGGRIVAENFKKALYDHFLGLCADESGGGMNCDELRACLDGMFETIEMNIDYIYQRTTSIEQNTENISQQVTQVYNEMNVTNNYNTYYYTQATKPPTVTADNSLDQLWGACKNAIEQWHTMYLDAFEKVEAQSTDNFSEVASILSGVFGVEMPIITTGFELVNWYFENIQATYIADFTPAVFDKACAELFCKIRSYGEPYPLYQEVLQLALINEIYNAIVAEAPSLANGWRNGALAMQDNFQKTLANLIDPRPEAYRRSYVENWFIRGKLNPSADWQVLAPNCATPTQSIARYLWSWANGDIASFTRPTGYTNVFRDKPLTTSGGYRGHGEYLGGGSSRYSSSFMRFDFAKSRVKNIRVGAMGNGTSSSFRRAIVKFYLNGAIIAQLQQNIGFNINNSYLFTLDSVGRDCDAIEILAESQQTYSGTTIYSIDIQ